MANIPLISFNTGEVSPKIDARSDVEKYSSSCRRLENMFGLQYGPAERRPGFKFIKAAKNSPEKIRMIAFIFSAEIAYMCEFGDQYIRFYFDGAELQDAIGNHVEIASPYAVADLPQLQITQFGDVMWIVHPSYAPYKLSRLTATSFSLDKIVFDDGPFLVRNDIDKDDDVTMTSSATAVGTTGTLTASSATFETGHIGALFKLLHPRAVTEVTQSGAGTSDALDVKGSWSYVSRGRWAGTVNVQRNEDGKGFEDFRSYTNTNVGDENIRLDRVESEERTQYRINAEAGVSSNFSARLQVFDFLRLSVVRINSLSSSTVANITVIAEVEDTSATVRWAEGA